MNPRAAEFRERFFNAMACTPEDAALFLSGGVDSCTNLAAALEMGRRPVCVTFKVEGVESRDVIVARAVANHFKLELIEETVKADLRDLVLDIKVVLVTIQKSTKTHVQCCHPFLYMGPAMWRRGIRRATWGMRAVWGISRDVAIAQDREGDAAAVTLRQKHFADPNFSEDSIEKILQSYGVTVSNPWREREFSKFFLGLTMAELHHPFEKAVAVQAFPEFWAQGEWRKPADNLQIGSGLRALHDRLIGSAYNLRGSKSVVGIYNQMLEQINQTQGELFS